MRWLVACVFLVAACAGEQPGVTRRAADADVLTEAAEQGITPDDFTTTSARITKPDGTTCVICVWLAADSDQRRRGLMFVTELAPAEAMAFLYPDSHTGTFWMKNTVLPLSIAFYSPAGEFMMSFDMEPCVVESCPRFATPADFLIAVETPQGDLESLGLTPGSRFELLDLPCGT